MEVITNLLPVKRGDPGRPVIPLSIGMVDFLEALCNFGSSVNTRRCSALATFLPSESR